MSAVRTTISEARLSELALAALRGFGLTQQDAADAPVLLPGEIELNHLARQRREGITLDAAMLAKLEAYAARGMETGDTA